MGQFIVTIITTSKGLGTAFDTLEVTGTADVRRVLFPAYATEITSYLLFTGHYGKSDHLYLHSNSCEMFCHPSYVPHILPRHKVFPDTLWLSTQCMYNVRNCLCSHNYNLLRTVAYDRCKVPLHEPSLYLIPHSVMCLPLMNYIAPLMAIHWCNGLCNWAWNCPIVDHLHIAGSNEVGA